MPIYVFRCTGCAAESDLLPPLGETGPRAGETCGATRRQRFRRVAVRYGSWGSTATDALVREPGRHDYRAVRERADKLSDES